MFARFDENPAMTLRVIKETKCYGRTDGQTDARTDNVKTVYPLQTKFAGGIITFLSCILFELLDVEHGSPISHKNVKCNSLGLALAIDPLPQGGI